MIKVEGTEVYADNIVLDRSKFILMKKCETKQKAVRFARIISRLHNEKMVIEENGYELI